MILICFSYMHFIGSYLLPVIMTFAWLSSLGIATYNLVYERQDGQEEVSQIVIDNTKVKLIMFFSIVFTFLCVISVP